MDIVDDRGAVVTLGDQIARGGEGAIYRLVSRPGLLAKIYSTPPSAQREPKLAWMRDHPPREPAGPRPIFSWPVALLFESGQCVGYLMPEVDGAATLQVVMNPRLRSLRWPQYDLKRLHRAARLLTHAAALAHAEGYVIGDVNQLNVLTSSDGYVTLIDTDSFQVTGDVQGNPFIYRCTVGVPEYQPPEMLALSDYRTVDRTPAQDYWGLAVLVFQLLMQGSHPFRAIWTPAGDPPDQLERIKHGYFAYGPQPVGPVHAPHTPRFDDLHPDVRHLVVRCFIGGHTAKDRRPTAHDWEVILRRAEDALVRCASGHFFQGHLPSCPTCAHPEPVASVRRTEANKHPARPHGAGLPRVPVGAGGLGIPPLPPVRPMPVLAAPGVVPGPAWTSPRARQPRLWLWTVRSLRVAIVVHLVAFALALTPGASPARSTREPRPA